MLTKKQKSQHVEEGKKLLKDSQSLVFVDFSGATVEEFKKLRRILRESRAKMKVFKKKLLRIALKENGVDFDPEQFEAQLATIFSPTDISTVAGPIFRFYKEIKDRGFKIMGGYDLSNKSAINADTVINIGQLPSREILLGQLVGMLSAPIKMFLQALSEKSKQTVEK